MAVTEALYTGNGSTTLFSFSFPYLEQADVKVTLNGTLTTAFTFASSSTIQFNSAPGAGVAIRIYRETDNNETAATFFSGSSIRAADLNDSFTQILYAVQEVYNRALTVLGGTMSGILNMGGFKITNLATPTVSTDAVTKQYADTLVSAGIADGDKGDITVSGSGTVYTIDNNVINNAKVASNAAISGTKISPSFGNQVVTTSSYLESTNQGEVRLVETDGLGGNYVSLKSPSSLAANATWILPSTDGIPGQFIQTNGTGTLSFANPSISNLADGTAAAPSLAFAADTNTGIYRVGADTFGITAGGTKIFEVNTLGVSGSLRRGTAITTTSGVSAGFTGIPSWARRITFILNGVSSTGNNGMLIQIGTSTGYVTTGYTAAIGTSASSSSGFSLKEGPLNATDSYEGIVTLVNITGNVWVASGSTCVATKGAVIAGSVNAGGVVDRIQVTTNSVDTLDAGSVNIIYEG